MEDITRKPLWPESSGGLKRSDQKIKRERERSDQSQVTWGLGALVRM